MDQDPQENSRAYRLTRFVSERDLPGGFSTHYMNYTVNGPDYPVFGLDVPCRGRLHHILTGLFYNWDWNDVQEKAITFDEAMMLKHIFDSQKEYKLWQTTMDKIKRDGVEATRAWLVEQVKVLALRNLMKGK